MEKDMPNILVLGDIWKPLYAEGIYTLYGSESG